MLLDSLKKRYRNIWFETMQYCEDGGENEWTTEGRTPIITVTPADDHSAHGHSAHEPDSTDDTSMDDPSVEDASEGIDDVVSSLRGSIDSIMNP